MKTKVTRIENDRTFHYAVFYQDHDSGIWIHDWQNFDSFKKAYHYAKGLSLKSVPPTIYFENGEEVK